MNFRTCWLYTTSTLLRITQVRDQLTMASTVPEAGENKGQVDNAFDKELLDNDASLREMIAKFESDVSLDPDTDLFVEPPDPVARDSDSVSNDSSLRDNEDLTGDNSDSGGGTRLKSSLQNGNTETTSTSMEASKESRDSSKKQIKLDKRSSKLAKETLSTKSNASSDSDSVASKQDSSEKSSKNPLKLLRRLTKFDKSSKKSSFRSEFSTVVVETLPQAFIVKYLGHREVGGVSGLHHVRKPVDEMVQQVRVRLEAKEEVGLPLLYVIVSANGLDLREHPNNKLKGKAPLGGIPIDFISYGVQDIKYWRVFTCIVVRTLSWQSRSATCHAFLCDSAQTGRKMALSLGAAFGVYSKRLKAEGKSHNFQVELRPPDEMASAVNECDA